MRISGSLFSFDPAAANKTGARKLKISGEEPSAVKTASKKSNGVLDFDVDYMKTQLEQMRESNKASAKEADARVKCMMIAMRFINGDEVPDADLKFLAKNDLELYLKAISLRRQNDDPKKYNKLTDDDDAEKNPPETAKLVAPSGIGGALDISL